MSDDMATDTAGSSWRDAAVARSLDPARARAEQRVQRFLDAALELMADSTDKEFTVQQVVERSGQSLRSFYQYFAGKYELLLALFEESVRSTAVHLGEVVAKESDPVEQLHAFALEYYRICQPIARGKDGRSGAGRAGAGRAGATKAGPTPAMAEFAQQLLTEHPKEASHAFVPLVDLLETLLDGAATAGSLRSGLDHRRIAGIVLQTIMFHAFATTISGTAPRGTSSSSVDAGAQELWGLILHGFGTP
jgi:AcrR family transcriptional regulator